MAGPDLGLGGKREELLVQGVEDAAGALRLLDGQVRAGDVADEQRVARQDGPWFVVTTASVAQRERRVFGAVPGGVKRLDTNRTEFELPAVVERLVLVLRRGVSVDVDRRAGRSGQPAVA